MTNPSTPVHTPELLTVSEAARLTGQPKAYLRELIESGRLALHLRKESGEQRTRLSRQTLVAAGLLREAASVEALAVAELTRLVAGLTDRLERVEREHRELLERFQAPATPSATLEPPAAAIVTASRARAGHPFNGRLPLPVRRLPFPSRARSRN
jgi:excisionase family DNA binding protein